MRKLIIIMALFFCCYSFADQITVINHVNKTLFAGVYYVKANIIGADIGPAVRTGDLQSLQANQKTNIVRPDTKKGMNRVLIFSFENNDLPAVITVGNYKQQTKMPVGRMHGNDYHIDLCDGRLCGYDAAHWKILRPIKNFFKTKTDALLQKFKEKFLKHPYGATRAAVRVQKTLSTDEIAAVGKRTARAKIFLEKNIGTKLTDNEMPKIAICLSGGGMRAVIGSFGFVAGLNDIGLLDTITYAATLSGSTWFLAHYLSLGMPMHQYEEELIKGLTKQHLLDPKVVSQVLLSKLTFGQEIGLIDLYGIYLSNQLFRNIADDADRQKVFLSDLAKRVENGDYFFPLFTAVETSFDYNWFTFTPYEIGSEQTGMFIPTWAFGRKFENGGSVDYAPEPPLGYFMGIWGSALSGTIGDILQRKDFAANLPETIGSIVREIIYSSRIDKFSMASAKIFNIAKGLNGLYKNNKKMTFVDAGFESYVPVPPLLNKERAIDIIIMLDVTMGVHSWPSLHDAQEYARAHQFPFPDIDYKGLTQRFISVFQNKNDPRCPTVIYVVPVKNDTFDSAFDPAKLFDKTYPTVKFTFARPQIEKLVGLIRKSIVDSKKIIIQAIKDKIKMKKEAQGAQ